MKNFKTAIDRTGTTTATRTIKCLRTLPSGEDLREYDELESKVLGKTNDHLNFIKEGLLVF